MPVINSRIKATSVKGPFATTNNSRSAEFYCYLMEIQLRFLLQNTGFTAVWDPDDIAINDEVPTLKLIDQ